MLNVDQLLAYFPNVENSFRNLIPDKTDNHLYGNQKLSFFILFRLTETKELRILQGRTISIEIKIKLTLYRQLNRRLSYSNTERKSIEH